MQYVFCLSSVSSTHVVRCITRIHVHSLNLVPSKNDSCVANVSPMTVGELLSMGTYFNSELGYNVLSDFVWRKLEKEFQSDINRLVRSRICKLYDKPTDEAFRSLRSEVVLCLYDMARTFKVSENGHSRSFHVYVRQYLARILDRSNPSYTTSQCKLLFSDDITEYKNSAIDGWSSNITLEQRVDISTAERELPSLSLDAESSFLKNVGLSTTEVRFLRDLMWADDPSKSVHGGTVSRGGGNTTDRVWFKPRSIEAIGKLWYTQGYWSELHSTTGRKPFASPISEQRGRLKRTCRDYLDSIHSSVQSKLKTYAKENPLLESYLYV